MILWVSKCQYEIEAYTVQYEINCEAVNRLKYMVKKNDSDTARRRFTQGKDKGFKFNQRAKRRRYRSISLLL